VSRRTFGAGIGGGDALDALSADLAYRRWAAERHSRRGYVEGQWSDRTPLAALLWLDIRFAYASGNVNDFEQGVFEESCDKDVSIADIVKHWPNEPYLNGGSWKERAFTEERARAIIRRVRRCVMRKEGLGLRTVVKEDMGWDGLGELLFR